MNDIATLLWKEYRNNAHLIIFGFSVLILPFVWSTSVVTLNAQAEATVADCLAAGLMIGAVVSVILSQFVLLCLGGHLIGGERGGRTFEFLFLQPISRLTIALSKLLFAFAWGTVTWMLLAGATVVGYLLLREENGPDFEFFKTGFFVEVAVVGFMLFSTAWLASSRLSNSVVAMCAGAFASSIVFLILMMVVGDRFEEVFTFNEYDWTRIIVMFPASLAAIVAGVFLFTTRKSP